MSLVHTTKVLGLSSGSSLDGINAAIIITDGVDVFERVQSFDIPYDRQELADYLEVDRSGLSAEISKLRSEGLLNSYKKHFELL